jgi:hypothetical protein
MPLARSTHWVSRFAPFALLIGAAAAFTQGMSGATPAVQPSPTRAAPTDVEVRCVDDSVVKMKLLDERLEVNTRYGKLEIPAAEIRRIEFATRMPSEVAERITLLISNLNHPDFDLREKAMAELRDYRERAYFPLLKAIKNPDAEISRRAEESVRYLQAKLPAGQLEPRANDVIYTDDSKITGKIVLPTLRVQTMMFGEQTLRLSDVRSLRSSGVFAPDDAANAAPAPTNLMAFQNQIGKEAVFSVTAPSGNQQGTSVWGTDIYSLDSNLAAAAMHAGLLVPGQTSVVRIRVVASPPQFLGNTRNGVTSAAYGAYPAGAFEFVKR